MTPTKPTVAELQRAYDQAFERDDIPTMVEMLIQLWCVESAHAADAHGTRPTGNLGEG